MRTPTRPSSSLGDEGAKPAAGPMAVNTVPAPRAVRRTFDEVKAAAQLSETMAAVRTVAKPIHMT